MSQPRVRVRPVTRGERAAVLALLDEGLRLPGTATRVWEDFPLALGERNCEGILVLEEDGVPQAGLSCLVREYVTSLGVLRVAAIGSVVTAPERRGCGLSRTLQAATIARLRGQGVPLGVLWSDRPDLYAGRGFRAAGWEHHFALEGWRPPPVENEQVAREYRPADAAAVAALYAAHPYRTVRKPGDAEVLYTMPGTRGLVLESPGGGRLAAYLFCGKGLDFPGYAVEWGGPAALVARLLAVARERLGVRRVLIPPGGEPLGQLLLAGGASCSAVPSGLWSVFAPEVLAARVPPDWAPPPESERQDPSSWLGRVNADGAVTPGPCSLAVWGFDSV